MSAQSIKEMGIDLCPNVLKHFLVVALSRVDLQVPCLRPVPRGSKKTVKAHVLFPPSYHFDIVHK